MRIFLSLALLAAAGSAPAQGTYEAITAYTATGPGIFNGTAGWTFQTTNSLTVTDLGCIANFFPNNPGALFLQVGLWAGTTLLASNTITPASALLNLSRYQSITPVFLVPGQTYRIGAYYSGGSFSLDTVIPSSGGSLTPSSDIQSIGAAQGYGGFASPTPEPGTPGIAYLGPNLLYQRGIPEPSSILLLGLGALLLAARLPRRPR